MNYKEIYNQKLLDIEGVLSKIESGDSLVVGWQPQSQLDYYLTYTS